MHLKKNELRFCLVFFSFIFLLIFFSTKLVLIQAFRSSFFTSLATKQHNYSIELEPIRGTIFDRNMRPLALNVTMFSLFANPKEMTKSDKEKAANQLSTILNINRDFIRERLMKDKYFVWIKRKLTAEQSDKVKLLKIKGLNFIDESKRIYPNGALAAHVVGFAGVDNNGLEGLELLYDKYLHGEKGSVEILRDARQRHLMIEKSYLAPKDGLDVVLTIDETIQYVAEQALDEAMKQYKAQAASIIVIDVKTGEILALANRPTYNLDQAQLSNLENRTNRAVSFVYEPGSVFKIVAAAAALEEQKYNERDIIFCENGKYRIANHFLTDHHPHGKLSFQEVIEVSSNIGVAKIAQKLGPDVIYKYGKRFRFGEKTGIDFKGEVSGWLKSPAQWSKTTIGAIPIGYEVTVTPLQLVYAVASIANEGLYMRPFMVKYIKDKQGNIIKEFAPEVVDRVISIDTAHRVKEILAGVVENGTGKRAQIEGVRVAGKTGTARKVVNGGYSQGKYYATFMGFAPADNPRLAAIVVVDQPSTYYFGGTVAAPVFKEAIEKSLKYLETSELAYKSDMGK